MRNPGLRTGRDSQTYDVGPGTPHGVWPLEAANDLEPGGTAARHLLATLSLLSSCTQGNENPSTRDMDFRPTQRLTHGEGFR